MKIIVLKNEIKKVKTKTRLRQKVVCHFISFKGRHIQYTVYITSGKLRRF